MRLYIFNFDAAPLAKAIAVGVFGIIVVWLITPSKLVFDETPVTATETSNELILEQYTYEYARKPIVLVGSSIQTMIPPPDCRPENVATIYLQARSAQTGLAAIIKVGARPKVVFVETATLASIVDPELMDAVFTPIYWQMRRIVSPLRFNRNWLVLLGRKLVYEHNLIEYEHNLVVYHLEKSPLTVVLPPESLEQWDKEVVSPRMAPSLRESNNDSNIRIAVEELIPLVQTLQQRGTRVIMYNPADPRIAKVSPMKDLTAAIRAALPDVEYIDPPDDKLPLYRFDGFHLVRASGVLLFNYLMERAGLSVRSPCGVRSVTATAAPKN